MTHFTLAVLLASVVASADGDCERFEFTGIEMAVPVRIVVYAPDEAVAKSATKAAFARFRELNAVMSDYDPDSEVRRLSASSGSGQAVEVGDDLWCVLSASKELTQRSSGAFDVTVGPIVRLWRRARRQERLPSPDRISQAKAAVGESTMVLGKSRKTVRLTKPGMWIDLGGIAKGYAIDAALDVLRDHGIHSALVDAGGDIGLSNTPPGRPGWVIGVASLERDAKPSVFLSISNVAIATSGDSWQFVEIEGRRYSHLVDPRTGIGLTDHSSVTVIAPNAMTADGLASAVSILGPDKGFELIDQYEGTAAFVVRAPSGKPETYCSSRWSRYPQVKPSEISAPTNK